MVEWFLFRQGGAGSKGVTAAWSRLRLGEGVCRELTEECRQSGPVREVCRAANGRMVEIPDGARGMQGADRRMVPIRPGYWALQGSQLSPVLADELHRIGSEALLNAFRHGRGSRVKMVLVFGADAFLLRVHDNGVGIDSKVLQDGHAPGRFGLRGMRERAERVHGTLQLSGALGGGTNLEFRASAAASYVARNRTVGLAWMRRLRLSRWFRNDSRQTAPDSNSPIE